MGRYTACHRPGDSPVGGADQVSRLDRAAPAGGEPVPPPLARDYARRLGRAGGGGGGPHREEGGGGSGGGTRKHARRNWPGGGLLLCPTPTPAPAPLLPPPRAGQG